MKRMLVLLAMVLVCSLGAEAAGGARAVIDLTPNRTYFIEDELVLFDGSNSYSDECDYVIACEWRVDGVLVSDQFTYSTAFTLAPGQVSKTVSVSLWVMDEYENTDDRTISIVIRRRPQPYFYLTDHLGSIRATVKGGEILVTDDFSGTLSKWTVAQGSGFAIESGVLSAAGTGRNIIVNSSAGVLADGIVVADIQTMSSPTQTPCIVVRYQDTSNYYYVRPSVNAILLYERVNGSETIRVTASFGDDVEPGVWYHLQVVTEGGKITVYTLGNTSPALEWTDPTPWLDGKVGLMQSGSAHAHWDNVTVTTGSPGQVVSADDYEAWGLVLESMSYVQGNSDTRYKFTGKERDAESLYDYFGVRYYDARIGRFLAIDPHASAYPGMNPFCYAGNNPLRFIDPTGMDSVDAALYHQMTDGLPMSRNMTICAMGMYGVYGEEESSPPSGNSNSEGPQGSSSTINLSGATLHILRFWGIRKEGKKLKEEIDKLSQFEIDNVGQLIVDERQEILLRREFEARGDARLMRIYDVLHTKLQHFRAYDRVYGAQAVAQIQIEWGEFVRYIAKELGISAEDLRKLEPHMRK